ncbi:MAG: YbjQ family protein [Chloroflexi bacterium]|nr:YbjQ family protein [Chloroflexota bacterium]
MIYLTTDTPEGMRVMKTLGLVNGSTVRARHIGRDIMAGLRGIVGGEVTEYTKLLAESRQQALQRLELRATEMGANAVIGLRFGTSMIMGGAAEILAYGTAVVLEEKAGA